MTTAPLAPIPIISSSGNTCSKRSLPSHPEESPAKRPSEDAPAKKQSKWSPQEDALITSLRASNMKWEDISRRLPGRSAISCRLHYQNYLERRSEWDEERKNKLARLYERFKPEMWGKLSEELGVPWRAAEAMHWQLGEESIARRAGVSPFSLTTSATTTTTATATATSITSTTMTSVSGIQTPAQEDDSTSPPKTRRSSAASTVGAASRRESTARGSVSGTLPSVAEFETTIERRAEELDRARERPSGRDRLRKLEKREDDNAGGGGASASGGDPRGTWR